MRFSKVIVIAVVALNVAFTAAVLYVAFRGGTVPDSLIYSWFGFTTGEMGILAWIKKMKAGGEKSADSTHQRDAPVEQSCEAGQENNSDPPGSPLDSQ